MRGRSPSDAQEPVQVTRNVDRPVQAGYRDTVRTPALRIQLASLSPSESRLAIFGCQRLGRKQCSSMPRFPTPGDQKGAVGLADSSLPSNGSTAALMVSAGVLREAHWLSARRTAQAIQGDATNLDQLCCLRLRDVVRVRAAVGPREEQAVSCLQGLDCGLVLLK